jgi:hypothetical protein
MWENVKIGSPICLKNVEFNIFTYVIENLKTPSNHDLIMTQYIRQKNFRALKSHDCHVLMQ